MSTSSESGHAKNLANFESELAFITDYGPAYNPSNPAIQLAALKTKAQEATAVLENLNNLLAANNVSVAARKVAFEPLNTLSTRIISALKATAVSQPLIDNATTNHRKLQGRRASAKLSEAEIKELADQGKIVKQVSAAQTGFDNIVATFDKQIKLLSSIPSYAPNEVGLQVATLTNQYKDLKAKNNEVLAQLSALSNGRLKRDEILYHPETGMVALALDAKNYIKSLFGTNTPQYKQMSKIQFRIVRT